MPKGDFWKLVCIAAVMSGNSYTVAQIAALADQLTEEANKRFPEKEY